MRLPAWPRRLWARRKRRADGARQRLLAPVRLSLRRLEERRVLDVGAAFLASTGELNLELFGAGESATISQQNGNIVVTDANQNAVEIYDENGQATSVGIGQVRSLDVQGDAAVDQSLTITIPLSPSDGMTIAPSLETVILQENVVADGAITIGANVVLADDVVLTARDVDLDAHVDDDGDGATGSALTVNASGVTRFGGRVGGDAPIDRLVTDSGGRTVINADISASGGTLIFNSPVELTSSVTLSDTGPTGIVFNSTVDSATGGHHALTLTATNGRVAINGDVGSGTAGDQRLGGLTVTEAADGVVFGEKFAPAFVRTLGPVNLGSVAGGVGGRGVLFNGNGGTATAPLLTFATGGGEFRLNGAGVLQSNLFVDTEGGDFLTTADAPIDGATNLNRTLTIDAGAGAVIVNQDIGRMNPLGSLTIIAATRGVIFGQADAAPPAGSAGIGPVSLIAARGPIDLGEGTNVVSGGVVFNAGNGNTLNIKTTGDPVRTNGPVELRSHLLIDTSSGGGDVIFTVDAPIDSQSGEANDITLHAGKGGVFFNADLGGTVPVGRLRILRADAGVTFGEADAKTADGGQGPVSRIHVVGGMDAGVGSMEITGAGIVLNGGSGSLEIESANEELRFNGRLTLASNVAMTTGAGAGDIVFTNDTPIDSAVGEMNHLRLNAGAGTVRFNEDIGNASSGSDTLLGSLIVERADGGVLLGETITEIPGMGGMGPVDRIRVAGAIDLGVATNVIQGGILLTGGAVDGLVASTEGGSIRLNGPVTLQTGARLETGAGAGDITFTSDAPVDSTIGQTSDLVLDAGVGAVSFNQNVGEAVALGELVIARAGGRVQFGGASMVGPDPGGRGPVEIVRAERGIDVGAGTNVVGGSGIDVNGGGETIVFSTDNQDIRFNGALDLQSSARLETGAGIGSIVFTSGTPIDSSDGPESATTAERNSLTLDAGLGQVVFNDNLGRTQRLDALTVLRAAAGVVFGGDDLPTTGGMGPVQSVWTDGAINVGAGSLAENVISGGIRFNGGPGAAASLDVSTSGDLVRLNGPVTAASKLTIRTSGGDLQLTAPAELDSEASESNDVIVDLAAGDGRFQGAIGSVNPLGALKIMSAHDLEFEQAVSVASITQVAGSGATTFRGAVMTTGATGLDLTGTNFTFDAPVTTQGSGGAKISQTGVLDINDAADLRLEGAFTQTGGGVTIAADIVTSGAEISFGGAVTLTDGTAADVHFDTTAGGNPAGAQILFGSTVDGETSGAEAIAINAGTGSDIRFEGAVGTGVRVGSVVVVQARDVSFLEAVVVGNLQQQAGQGDTLFGGAIDANSLLEKSLDVTTMTVFVKDAVTTQGDGRVEFTVSALLEIGADADMVLAGAFLQNGGGVTQTSGDITTTNQHIEFTNAVTLRDDVAMDTGAGGGDIRFLSTLEGTTECGQHPTFTSGTGEIRFADSVGSMAPLGDVVMVSAGDVVFESTLDAKSFRQDSSTGETRFATTVTIKGADGVDVTAGSVRFDGDVSTALRNAQIRVSATDDILVNALLASGGGAVTLEAGDQVMLTGVASILTSDSIVTITADSDDAGGGGLTMSDGATIRTGDGAIKLTAGDDIQLGGLLTTTEVTVTSHDGAIRDTGEIAGFDITADRVALRARHGIGTTNPLDLRINVIAAENLEEGGIRFNNRPAEGQQSRLLKIATVDGFTGITAGPAAAADAADLGGDVEISNVGDIDVDAAIQNNAGGHTTVRAEVTGNLHVNQPIQNRGGDGWIILFAGGDLVINNSLPEFIGGDPTQPFPEAEVSVQHEGAIRGQARGNVIVDNSPTDYVIIRTHAERFPDPASLPTLDPKFSDPTDFPENDPAFYAELDAALAAQRDAVSAQITNVAPIFDIESIDQGGSNLDEKARGILKITIGDEFHLERNFHVTVDWGDGNIENYTIPGNLRASDGFILADGTRSNFMPDATITASFDSGELLPDGTRMAGVYYIHHTYIEPPDLGDPAAPIPVSAQIRYDARAEGEISLDLIMPPDGSEIFNGIRFFENLTQEIFSTDNDVMTNPGQGAFAFIKVIESEIIPVEQRKVTTALVTSNTVSVTATVGEQFEFTSTQFEAQSFEDYRLYFSVVDDATGVEFGKFNLPDEAITNPIGVVTSDYHFPNGHYRIYLEDLRTKRTRMILEVHIYEGRVVPPNFRQGATERQPGSDAAEESDNAPSPDSGAGLEASPEANSAAVADRRGEVESDLNATDRGTLQASPKHALMAGAAATMALQPILRRRLKRPEPGARLDRAARIMRRLRNKLTH